MATESRRYNVGLTDEVKRMVDVIAMFHGWDRNETIRRLAQARYKRVMEKVTK
jgi:hypothetical protein